MADTRLENARPLTSESKSGTKTTEFRLTVLVILLILISAFLVKGGDSKGAVFNARNAWLYVPIVTGAYSVARGLPKSGVREYPEELSERLTDTKKNN